MFSGRKAMDKESAMSAPSSLSGERGEPRKNLIVEETQEMSGTPRQINTYIFRTVLGKDRFA